MINAKKDILRKTAEEYFQSANEELSKGRNNSAVVLYFKSLVAWIDLYLLIRLGKTPSSHGERFLLTKENFPDVYNLLDKDFPFYQDSYNIIMSKELAEVIKHDAQKIAGKIGFNL